MVFQSEEMLYCHCFFSFASDLAIRNGHNIHVELKLHWTCQILVSADDINLLGDKIGIMKHTKALIDTSEEVGIEANAEKTKHILLIITRMQDKIIAIRYQTDPLKMLHSSNIYRNDSNITSKWSVGS
jgi:hypothetical protein